MLVRPGRIPDQAAGRLSSDASSVDASYTPDHHECYKPGTIVGCSKCDPTKSQTSWTKITGCVSDLAKLATGATSGGGSGTYGPKIMNDGQGESSGKFCWVSASSSPKSGKWAMYTWTKTVQVSSVKFDTGAVCSAGGSR